MLWLGISIEPEWVALALLVIAIAMGRGRTFITDWTPFLLLFSLSVRGFAPPRTTTSRDWAWVSGQIPTQFSACLLP
jgi:hypothetical protein